LPEHLDPHLCSPNHARAMPLSTHLTASESYIKSANLSVIVSCHADCQVHVCICICIVCMWDVHLYIRHHADCQTHVCTCIVCMYDVHLYIRHHAYCRKQGNNRYVCTHACMCKFHVCRYVCLYWHVSYMLAVNTWATYSTWHQFRLSMTNAILHTRGQVRSGIEYLYTKLADIEIEGDADETVITEVSLFQIMCMYFCMHTYCAHTMYVWSLRWACFR
jgi:hypothetical protein